MVHTVCHKSHCLKTTCTNIGFFLLIWQLCVAKKQSLHKNFSLHAWHDVLTLLEYFTIIFHFYHCFVALSVSSSLVFFSKLMVFFRCSCLICLHLTIVDFFKNFVHDLCSHVYIFIKVPKVSSIYWPCAKLFRQNLSTTWTNRYNKHLNLM